MPCLFSTKDKVPYCLKSFTIYKFLCAGCNASYAGETYRHISTRTYENLGTGKKSRFTNNPVKNCNANQNLMRTVFRF